MDRDGLSLFDAVVLTVGGAVVLVVAVVWGGAMLALLAIGEGAVLPVADAAEAVPGLVDHVGDPAGAWSAPAAGRLPGPVVYWACTAVAAGIAVALVAGALRLLGGPRAGTARRRPLGVDARPAWATWRGLRPLLVRRAVPGRFIVARFGRWFVATEAAGTSRGRRRRRGGARRGDRGAVALVGPTRSGKTVAAISGILEWDGPAVLSSVKADLLGSTLGWRAEQGEVRVYDPTRTLGPVGGATVGPACWSPVGQASTVVGAQRAARALCEAAPRGGVEGGMDFWLA